VKAKHAIARTPNKFTPAAVRRTIQEAVKGALEVRDQAWMRAIENHRRAWEQKLAGLIGELDGALHAVPFEPPPQAVTIEVRFGKGFGARESQAARRKK